MGSLIQFSKHILPIPSNYSRIIDMHFSKVDMDVSTRESAKIWVAEKLTSTVGNSYKQEMITSLFITIIASVAIAYLSTKIALGCIAASLLAYAHFSKKEIKASTLVGTMLADKTLTHLVDPKQAEENLKVLKKDLEYLESHLKVLEEEPLFDALDAKSMERKKKMIEGLSEQKTYLEEKRESLQKGLPFFQQNAPFLKKLASTWLIIDQNIVDRTAACQGFIFYSLVGVFSIKTGFASKNAYTHTMHTLMAVGALSIAYAAKHVFSMVKHKDDEAKKEKALAAITKNEVDQYNSSLSEFSIDLP
ncbi:MAG: hypothetical protein ACRCU0_05340 [Candidatus Rhabdochlamydia sp.]